MAGCLGLRIEAVQVGQVFDGAGSPKTRGWGSATEPWFIWLSPIVPSLNSTTSAWRGGLSSGWRLSSGNPASSKAMTPGQRQPLPPGSCWSAQKQGYCLHLPQPKARRRDPRSCPRRKRRRKWRKKRKMPPLPARKCRVLAAPSPAPQRAPARAITGAHWMCCVG